MSNQDGQQLGNIGKLGYGSDYLQAIASDVWGISFHARKWVNSQRDEVRKFYTHAPAHQLISILTNYAEGRHRNALQLGPVLDKLEALVTTIRVAQEIEHQEIESFREAMRPKPLIEA